MNELKVDNVIISRQGKDSSNYQEFIRIINKKKINVIEVEKRRWIINWKIHKNPNFMAEERTNYRKYIE